MILKKQRKIKRDSFCLQGSWQETFITAEQLVFIRVKHTSCWSTEKHPHLSYPPPTFSSIVSNFKLFACDYSYINFTSYTLKLFFVVPPYSFVLSADLSFPLLSPSRPLSLFHSMYPLMLAQTCCHIPPVQFSTGQDWIQLNYSTVWIRL